jgi:glycogen debranching enzyme
MFVLKHNDSFAILDASGNIWGKNRTDNSISDGLLHNDTRILSRAILTAGNKALLPVQSAIKNDNVIFEAKLTNAALKDIPEGVLEIKRTIFLWNDNLYEKTEVRNTTASKIDVPFEFSSAADFLDIFEVRGAKREKRGETHPPEQSASGVKYSYTGLDKVQRATAVSFSPAPDSSVDGAAIFNLHIPPQGTQTLYKKMGIAGSSAGISKESFEKAQKDALAFVQKQLDHRPKITSSNKAFDQWVHQDAVDIILLTTELKTGLYPYAGIPWYSTAFGRDGIITAFQMLWQDPSLAKGTLSLLAAKQADKTSAFHDCEPGKILHEIRLGEMANTGEIPHSPYYGTADATPLFIFLAGAYYERTGDAAFIKSIWPNIEQALNWIDQYGDKDGDGFVEYLRGTEKGLSNQGWKDSVDAISHADGTLAPGSIALCEVQGYVYAAKHAAAEMARVLGKNALADQLEESAATLKEKFNDKFWSDELGTYALALDGQKKPCLVNTSNPGHLLFSGIVPDDRAKKVAEKLMAPDMFSGWGIRTLATNEKRYEPLKHPQGYHNGTVWVHDTAICAAGFERYHMEDKAARLLTALFNAAGHFPDMRLPELFGGLPREAKAAPAFYPVACNPQAWASGSGSMMLQSMLGIRIDGKNKRVMVENPRLPAWLEDISIQNIRIGNSAISLKFQRQDKGVNVTVINKSNDIDFQLISPAKKSEENIPRIKKG